MMLQRSHTSGLRGASSSSSASSRTGRQLVSSTNRAPVTRRQQSLLTRAAEEEEQPAAAAVEEEGADSGEAPAEVAIAANDFDFSYSDAKKGNQWQPSDVDAALAYYSDERFLTGSSDMPYEADFVVNPLSAYAGGPEDSSWLADVDNNDAYERDEYSLAGIPEAAPKMKRREDVEDEEASEELRQLEEEKIGAAAFDDIEGLDDDDDPSAVWNWALDGAEDTSAGASAALAANTQPPLLASITDADVAQHSELTPIQKDVVQLLLDPIGAVGGDEGLDLVGQELPPLDDAALTTPALSAEEEAAIASVLAEGAADSAAADAVLAQANALTDSLGAALAEATAQAEAAGADAPLSEAAVSEYLAALRSIGAAGGSAGVPEASLAELLGGEPSEVAGPDMGSGLLSLGELPSLPAGLAAALQQQAPELPRFTPAASGPEEAEASEALGLLEGLASLASEVDGFNEAVLPAAEDLQEWEAFIDSSLEYYEAGGSGEGEWSLAERPQDAPVNPFDDPDPALLGADAFGAAEDEEGPGGRYAPQYAERILELGRVTKVVKGGKLMGFRCVAVVGDGKGKVGVGCQAGREVATAVKRALSDAKKNIVEVPLVGAGTIPHRSEAWFKAAGVVLQPAADGTGVIAGGAVRAVLELAGVRNVLGKRLGSRSTLNNARVTLKALSSLRTLDDYAEARGVPLDYLRS